MASFSVFKVSNICAVLCFNLAVFCPSKGEVFQPRDHSLVPSENIYHPINQYKNEGYTRKYSCYKKCDFESEPCNTITNGNASTGWIRRNGVNAIGSLHSDHNGNNIAHFLSLPSGPTSLPAVLRSSVIFVAKNQLTCQVIFYYWIGQVNGTLTVTLQTLSDTVLKTIRMERKGTKNQWQRAVVTINNTLNTELTQVSIQGQIFEPGTAEETIAIDDLSVTEGCLLAFADPTSLSTESCHAHNETRMPSRELFINAPSISLNATHGGFCFQQVHNFKVHVCDWSSDKSSGHVSWVPVEQLVGGGLRSILLKDGSNDTRGHYKWVQTEDDMSHNNLNASMCHCFNHKCHFWFYYSMEENSILEAVLYTSKDENVRLWRASVPTNKEWVKAEVHIPAGLEKRKLLLEGTMESKISTLCLDHCGFEDTMSELAQVCSSEEFACANGQCINNGLVCDYQMDCLDGSDEDLAACVDAKRETSDASSLYCPPGFLPCQDGDCVSSDKFCDFTPDCPDGSDEAMCPAECDFEKDSCGWLETAGGDAFDWIRGSVHHLPPAFQKQAPPHDHTYNQSSGHFMFILKNSSSITQIAQLRSPKFRQAGPHCSVTFWYYNYGMSVGAAEMQLLVDGLQDPTVLWRIYYNQGDQWLKASIQLGRLLQPFQLSLNKVSLGFYDGVSAIDDITFEACALPSPAFNCEGPDRFWCQDSKACIESLLLCDLVDDCGDESDEKVCASELQCNFELGLCNWEQDLDDDFNWTRNQGLTPTLNTGPTKDHTLGTSKGHYLYIESSEPQMFQNKAALLSPVFAATSAQGNKSCLFRFHYHMFGKHVYRLAVSQRTMSNTRGHLLWHAFGNQGNRWIKEVLYITSSEPFQILVEGTVGDGFTGDVAIDDLSFMDCTLFNGSLPAGVITPSGTSVPVTLPMNNCTEKEFVCRATGQCINITQHCDFQPDCSDKSDESFCASDACNFEHGNLCEWYQPAAIVAKTTSPYATHAFQWALGKGATIHPGEENHRALIDHTKATRGGWYLYADSSNGHFGHTAEIVTPVISQTGPKCKLVFWNYMNGATVGSLEVLINVRNTTTRLWAQSGPQGPQWNNAEVFLGVCSYFQVLFRAKRGISYVGDVAVDDISFKDCSPLQIPDKPCTSEEFTCANKYCIPQESLCDFVNDCADNSDEHDSICSVSIGRCSFEFDLCEWEQDHNDDFDWNLRNGGLPRAGTGPIADHSLQEPSGHYIFIKNFFPQLPGQEARIFSVIISKKSKNCKIIFYYHMYGENIGSLTVYQETVSHLSKVLFTLSGDQGNFWKRKVLPLEADEDFRVIFEGRVGNAYRRSIALDDIVFTRECLLSNILSEEPTELPVTGPCFPGYLECLNGQCYRAEQHCNFEDDCGDNTDERECGTSCTFENEMCGWRNSLADNFDWMVGRSLPQGLVPSKDHTLGDRKGHFLYLRAKSTGMRGEKAHLKSSRWTESSTACTLNFWYYMSSKSSGHIQVLVKTESKVLRMWSHSGDYGDQWKKAEVHLGRLRNFEVLFEGIRTKDLGGGAAIDDIEYANCSTIGENPGVCPADTDYVCWNKKCIESRLVCDYKPDCKDWSDETDCSRYTALPGSCNFETQGQDWTTECGFTQDPADELDWHMSDRTVIEREDLTRDHTPGNGHNFLYVNSSTQQKGRAKIITTKYFPASLGVCRLRFWFWMCNSPNVGILKVLTVEEFGMDLLMWAATGKQRSAWTYANVALSSNRPFQVAFEADVGANEAIEFALDDISFTPECASEGSIGPQPPTCNSDQFTCVYVKECVPLSAKCNRVEDCADGTDEMACPTEKPTAVSPRLCRDTEFQCGNQLCIPSLLRCDGVPDCIFNEDETNCPIKDCFDGFLLCPSTNSCIPASQRCDGIADCIDLVPDESSCSECPEAYCKNGGICIKEPVPICQCGKEWKGNRCHIKAKPPLSPSSGFLQNDTWTWLGIGLAFLLIEIAVAVSCILSKRKLPGTKPEELSNTAFDNPLYEAQGVKSTECAASLGVQISVSPWQTQQEFSCSNDRTATSFANPLYGPATGRTVEAP